MPQVFYKSCLVFHLYLKLSELFAIYGPYNASVYISKINRPGMLSLMSAQDGSISRYWCSLTDSAAAITILPDNYLIILYTGLPMYTGYLLFMPTESPE